MGDLQVEIKAGSPILICDTCINHDGNSYKWDIATNLTGTYVLELCDCNSGVPPTNYCCWQNNENGVTGTWWEAPDCAGDGNALSGRIWLVAEYYGSGSWHLEIYFRSSKWDHFDLVYYGDEAFGAVIGCEPNDNEVVNQKVDAQCGNAGGVNVVCNVTNNPGYVVGYNGSAFLTHPV